MKKIELIPFYKKENRVTLQVSAFPLEGKFNLEFAVSSLASQVQIPQPSATPSRVDGLYHNTCFEVFVMNPSGKYVEWNFSPSGDWCVFSFEGYRKKTLDFLGKESFTQNAFSIEAGKLKMQVSLDKEKVQKALGSENLKVSCTAVMEYSSGEKDYFALAHPSDKPDFHDSKGFLIDW